MTDLELYTLLEDVCDEVHDDGMCFVPSYKYEDFVKELKINDCESGFDAYVSTDGCLCFDIANLELFADDIQEVKKCLIKHFNE